MKVIVRAPNWVGDAVLSLPAVAAVRENIPETEIWVAAKRDIGEIYAAAGLADGLLPLPADNAPGSLRRAARQIGRGAFDAGLLLDKLVRLRPSLSSRGRPRALGLRGRWTIAALDPAGPQKETRAPFVTISISISISSRPSASRRPARSRGSRPAPRRSRRPAGGFAAWGSTPRRPLVILCPGASYGPAKRWPPERFAEAAALLQERRGAEVLVIGSPAELDLAESIRGRLARPPAVLTGQTGLRDLLGVMATATLVLANDTGPMHLASALGVPVVGVFGPTDPAATAPFSQPSRVVKKDVPCWPCLHRKCPLDHRCMTLVSAEDVAAAAEAIWP